MSVWLTIPSARPDGGTVQLWKDRGYGIALWRDREDGVRERFSAEGLVIVAPYPGYANAVNALTKAVLKLDPDCSFCVAGGDDTEPDPNHSPEVIAAECREYFESRWDSKTHTERRAAGKVQTFGVMQPTGDRFAQGSIDRIAGSPWMGRQWCERMYGGEGPLWPGWKHMFVDEELQAVAQKLGVFWQRPDLVHLHHHFMRETPGINSRAVHKPIPAHLVEANSPEHWHKYQALFQQRKALGFPGHEPLAPEWNAPKVVRNQKLDNGDPDLIEVRP